MEAGKLNRIITVQSVTATYNDNRTKNEAWADSFKVNAEVVTSGGGIYYAAQKQNMETTAVFRVRYTSRITRENRIKYEGRIFTILHLNDVDGKRAELRISAKEVV
jgi:SPP1 family predicted phage head-tail adaptor